MATVWGVFVVVVSGVCWGGQAVSWFSPATGVRLGLMEAEDTVEPAFFADVRGEALWDTLTLWTMPIAGALLLAGNAAWTYFGLFGGAVYFYFAGRGVFTRVALLRRGMQIGTRQNVRLGLALLAVWGTMGIVTVIAATLSLTS